MLKLLMIMAISSPNYVLCSLLTSQSNKIFEAMENDEWKVVEWLIEENVHRLDLLNNYGKTLLHIAVKKGNKSIIMLLLDKRANTEAQDMYGNTPLHTAAAEGNESIIKLLLGMRANIEAQDKDDWTPLHTAADGENVSIIKLLLDMKANIEARARFNMTPLHRAVIKGTVSIIQLLLCKGANIEAQDTDDWTPLHKAARFRNESIVKLLLDKGANIESQDSFGRTPLLIAASAKEVEICKLLIRKSANIYKKDISGNNALHLIILSSPRGIPSGSKVSYRCEMVLRLFLENGLNIDEKNNDKDTPLHIATERSDSRSCWLLLRKKADIDARNRNMRSAFHLAAQRSFVIDTILTYRPYVDLRDEFGCEPLHYACLGESCFARFKSLPNNLEETNLSRWKPLHIACSANNSNAVERLLRQGVDVNRQIGKSGKTALMIACQKGYKEICILLLSDGALDKDARDNDLYGTALDWACEFEHLEICKLLLDKGFTYKRLYEKFRLLRRACRNDHVGLCEVILDVFFLWDKVDEKGNSVIHYACTYGSKEVVEFVLRKHKDKGLQVNSKNLGGKLAFHLAEENQLTDVVKLLTMYGVRPTKEKNRGGS